MIIPLAHSQVQMENLSVLSILNRGGFGAVYLAYSEDLRSFFALKVIPKRLVAIKKQVPHVAAEKSLLQACNHPFIVSL